MCCGFGVLLGVVIVFFSFFDVFKGGGGGGGGGGLVVEWTIHAPSYPSARKKSSP